MPPPRRSARSAPAGSPAPGSRTVRTDDGVDLHVEVDGPADAPLTVLLTHGFTARLGEFLNATTPSGPVLLAGHSLGGMSVLALARRRPELFGTRVVGVFLLATSAGGLVETGPLGLFIKLVRKLRLLSLYLRFLQLLAPLLERVRRRGTRLGRRVTRRLLFGADDADLANVRLVQELLEETPYPVAMAFYATFLDHDETASLEMLRGVPVTVIAATHDRLTPATHGRDIASRIGENAELVVVPGAGHSVNLTRTHIVDDALNALMDKVEAG